MCVARFVATTSGSMHCLLFCNDITHKCSTAIGPRESLYAFFFERARDSRRGTRCMRRRRTVPLTRNFSTMHRRDANGRLTKHVTKVRDYLGILDQLLLQYTARCLESREIEDLCRFQRDLRLPEFAPIDRRAKRTRRGRRCEILWDSKGGSESHGDGRGGWWKWWRRRAGLEQERALHRSHAIRARDCFVFRHRATRALPDHRPLPALPSSPLSPSCLTLPVLPRPPANDLVGIQKKTIHPRSTSPSPSAVQSPRPQHPTRPPHQSVCRRRHCSRKVLLAGRDPLTVDMFPQGRTIHHSRHLVLYTATND